MLPVRVAFDASLPIVVSQDFTIGGRTFKAETPFAWRDVIDEATLYNFYRSGLVRCEPAKVAALKVTPGELVSVKPPGKRKSA